MFQESRDSIILYYFVGSFIVMLLIISIITYAVLYQKKIAALRTRLHNEELRRQQAIYEALQEGQEKERTRLSQELHDGVGAKLSGLKMALEYLNLNATEHTTLISKIFLEITEAIQEVKEISHDLQPIFFNNSIELLLHNLIEQHNTIETCNYSLSMNNSLEEKLDENLKLHIYRIISELLNNIRKYAQATQASVQVDIENDVIIITIEDNGIGINNVQYNVEGLGFKNITNRVNIYNGHMSIDSSEKGTSVIIEIPININK